MNLLHCERTKPSRCVAALAFLTASMLTAQSAMQNLDLQADQAERDVRDLAKEFAEILAPTPLETQLRARCRTNCTAIWDSGKGLTVAQELETISAHTQAEMAHVGAEIQGSVNSYIASSVSVSDETFHRNSVIENLAQILSGVADQPPVTFPLNAGKTRGLLVFYDVSTPTVASYATLVAFNSDGGRLTYSDSTGTVFNGYSRIEVKRLPAPVQGEAWVLVSGYASGANGPNCRMRVFAYDGTKFRTVWAPANIWGSFATQVTNDGFVVSGDYLSIEPAQGRSLPAQLRRDLFGAMGEVSRPQPGRSRLTRLGISA
jgi:hypothetical protein